MLEIIAITAVLALAIWAGYRLGVLFKTPLSWVLLAVVGIAACIFVPAGGDLYGIMAGLSVRGLILGLMARAVFA